MIEILLQAERSLTVGQLDAAERLYWQAIEGDPRNSIAVVGLARVALDRGDERAAYQLARKALEIDTENAAAQRLVSRLAEVMVHRGEQVPTEPTPTLRHRPTDGGMRPTDGGTRPTDGGTRPTDDGAGAADAPSRATDGEARPADSPVSATNSARDGASPTPSQPRAASAPASRKRPGLLRRILGR